MPDQGRRPVRRPRGLLGGHLGSSVSALVDGQLDEEAGERAWQHVQHCPSCRRLVEREGWVKRQLAQMAGSAPPADYPSDRLVGSLLGLDPAPLAWTEAHDLEHRGRARRRAGIALVGAGSVSAAVFGLSTLSGTSMGIGGSTPSSPAASVGAGASSAPRNAVVSPAASVHGRLRGWTLGRGVDGVVHARAVGDDR